MVAISAAVQAARMFAAPAVKLIIAGTRPADIAARIVDGGAVRVRQHDAERLALFGERDELAAEHVRADEQPLVGQRSGDRVLDGDPAPAMGRCRLDHGLEHGAIRRGGPEDEVGHDLVERRARRLAAVAALERRIDREPHRLEHRHRHLRPPAAAHLLARQPREKRALEALDLHRQDHGVGLVGDEAGAVVDLHQAAGDGEAPLGEDDQRLAALDGVDQRPRRHRLCRIERHRAGDLQERAHPPALGDAVIDGEDRLLVEERERERGVEEADMVQRHDRVRAGLGDVLEPLHLEPVEGPEEDREEIAERARRQRPEDDQAGQDVG